MGVNDTYERYKGIMIFQSTKKVFGKPIPMWNVESYDTVIFCNKDIQKCREFVDDFINAMKKS